MKKKPAVTSVQPQSSSITDATKEDEKQEQLLQRKIALATEGFATIKYFEKVLQNRNRLSQENALTIAEYIMSMKREVKYIEPTCLLDCK
jgi:tRNA isopentenyl-2-thiomethyl-A-37 hydroxylase MiaE